MRSPSSPVVSRRRVLGATVAAAAVATTGGLVSGCTTQPGSGARTPGTPDARTPGTDPASGAGPDVRLAAAVRAEEEAALLLVQATATRHRSLRRTLRAAEAGHAAHLALLADVVPDDAGPGTGLPDAGAPTVPADRAAALRRVTRTEQRLATSLKRHAFAAESGPFARLLGSMAGAAAQQATVLGGTSGPAGAA